MPERAREAMPRTVSKALAEHGQRKAYDARPPYQRNDYLRWIKQAKQDETRDKRIGQMIAELKKGDVYMGADWRGGSD